MSETQGEPRQTAAQQVQRLAAVAAARLGIGPAEAEDARAYWLTLALLVGGAGATVALAVGFAELAEALGSRALAAVDDWAASVASAQRSPLGTRWARAITFAGDTEAYVALLAPAVLWLLWARRLWESGFLLLTALGTTAIMWALKWGYQRPRPLGEHYAPTVGASFPSGHAMVAMSIYLALAYLTWNWMPRPAARWLAAALYGALVLAIGLSRVSLGVHWLSDVAAGFLAGGAWTATCILGLEWLRWRERRQSARESAAVRPPSDDPLREGGEATMRRTDGQRGPPLWVLGVALLVGVGAVIAVGHASARRQDRREALAQALAASGLPVSFEHEGRQWRADELEEPHDRELRALRPVGRLPDGHLLYARVRAPRRELFLKVEEPASLAGTWVEYEGTR